MKIVFVTPSIKTGGGNRVFIELANRLCITNEVSVVYPNNSLDVNTFQKQDAVRFVSVGKFAASKVGKLVNMVRCIHYLNTLPATVKLIFTDPIFCLLIPLLCNKKNVYRFIQADDYRIFDDGKVLGNGVALKLYKKRCLKSYRQKIKFIFNSCFVYDRFCTDSKRNDIPFNLVHPAIDHIIFKPVERESSPFHGCSLCLIARKHPWKGLATFINAYHSMPLEMKERISCIKLVSHDDLSDFDTTGMEIVRPTCDEDIAHVYQESDIFISTSWWEGFGLPPLEAMACGCAVITSESGGVNEFAVDGVNCLMYEPKNENQLLEKLSVMMLNLDLRKRLAKQGIKTAKDFSWNKSANQLIHIL